MNHSSPTNSASGNVRSAAVICVLLAMSAGAFADDLGFLLHSVWSKLSSEDIGLAESAALGLLKDGKLGESRDWANPNSTAKGTLKIVKVFRSQEGSSCLSTNMNSPIGLPLPSRRIPGSKWAPCIPLSFLISFRIFPIQRVSTDPICRQRRNYWRHR
jgi:hypothetical protein